MKTITMVDQLARYIFGYRGTCDPLDQWPRGAIKINDLTNQDNNYGWPIELAHVTYLLSHGDINVFEWPMGGTCDTLDQWPGGDQDKDLAN